MSFKVLKFVVENTAPVRGGVQLYGVGSGDNPPSGDFGFFDFVLGIAVIELPPVGLSSSSSLI